MSGIMEENQYMSRALELAREAAAEEETPIGCVIVRDGEIIGEGRNRRNTLKDPLAHAEMEAIRQASKKVGDRRLEDCTLYVTLEPCPMCAGAIVQGFFAMLRQKAAAEKLREEEEKEA